MLASAAAAWDWGKEAWAKAMSLLMCIRMAVSLASARSRRMILEGSSTGSASVVSGWRAREKDSSSMTTSSASSEAWELREAAVPPVGVAGEKSRRRFTLVRRFGDNGELATRGLVGAMVGWASDEAAASAVAREVLEALEDGGGTHSSRMPLAQPRERMRMTMVEVRAGPEV